MEVKTPNQISHDSWYKERGHSTGTSFSASRSTGRSTCTWPTM